METKNITLLVWDSEENFSDKSTQGQLGFYNGKQGVYKTVVRVDDRTFESAFDALSFNDPFVVVCHVSQTKDFEVYFSFINSNVKSSYKNLNVAFVSKGDSGEVMKKLHKQKDIQEKVVSYKNLKDSLASEEIRCQMKSQFVSIGSEGGEFISDRPNYPQIDYAIITALYKDEFEQISRIFNFNSKDIIRTEKKEYHVGTLKSDVSKKVVAAIPTATGMVDSAIIATQMLDFFRPKYLLMSGVCGGRKDLQFGDIIIASQIFTFQKGKISDVNIKNANGELEKIQLFDEVGKIIDSNKFVDQNGKSISVSIEKFDVEHDSMLQLHSLEKDKIERNIEKMKKGINALLAEQITPLRTAIDIILEPMACSTMVINKAGYFEDKIKIINRKTAAVEMESYGVARACEFANNGKTKAIIFKSVMDNTEDKDDRAKKFAAFTSAQLLQQLFENQILD